MTRAGLAALLAAVVLGTACGEREIRAESAGATVVDSAVPIAVALEKFRRGLPRPASLTGGEASREVLVGRFIAALEDSDTAALRRMVLQQGEFAWLYYPTTVLARPPYELPPDLLWFQMRGQTEKGASLLLAERAGTALGYLDHDCASQREEGENMVYGHCVIRRVTASGDTVRDRLFGLIVRRDGMHKFVSYANKLD